MKKRERMVPTSVTLPKDVKEDLEKLASRDGRSVSSFLCQLAIKEIRRRKSEITVDPQGEVDR